MNDDSHPVLTTVGLAAVALGVLMVVQPSVAAAIGVDYAAVIVVGLLALVQGVRVARARQASEIRGAETPDVETVETRPTPGDDFDRTVAQLGSGPRRVLIRERADLRETLEDAAITAVADRENCSREEAVERVETGAWTDDPHAASLLGGSEAPSPPLMDRIRIAASTESSFQHRVRRTADAIAGVAGVTPDEEGEGEGEQGESSPDDETTPGERKIEVGYETEADSGTDADAATDSDSDDDSDSATDGDATANRGVEA